MADKEIPTEPPLEVFHECEKCGTEFSANHPEVERDTVFGPICPECGHKYTRTNRY